MTTRDEILSAMEAARLEWSQRRETVEMVARIRRISDSELARRVDMTPQALNARLLGRTNIQQWELIGFALALEVPIEVLYMQVSEAMHWVADHIRNTCFPGMGFRAA